MTSLKSTAEMTAKAPQRRRGRDRVAALLDAAAGVFARAGYEAATMTEVAATAGASIGSLYQFFPTKPLLADALYLREMDALAAALGQAGDEALAASAPLADVGEALFMALIAFVDGHPALPVVADRRGAEVSRQAGRPGMREQLAAILARVEPPPGLQQARHAAGLLLLMMKGTVAVRAARDPDAAALLEDARLMLRGRLAGFVEKPPRDVQGQARSIG